MRTLAEIALGCAIFFQAGGGHSRQVGDGPATYTMASALSAPGMPFSADLVIEHDQTLADGTHIHVVEHERIFRDSEGRLRKEIYGRQGGNKRNPGKLTAVTIVDAVARVQYALTPRSHVALRNSVFPPYDDASEFPPPPSSPSQQPLNPQK